MFLCLLLGITGATLFFMNTKPDPMLRELGAAYITHQEQLKKAPRDPRLLYNDAWFLAQKQAYPEALKQIEKALKHDPHQARYLYTRAWLYQKLGSDNQAAKDIARAQSLPFQPRNLNESLRMHLLNNTPAEGLKQVEYELAKQLAPPEGLFYWRSLFQEQLHAYEAAIADLSRLLPSAEEQKPVVLTSDIHTKLLLKRAELYEKTEQYKQALNDLKTVSADEDSSLSAAARQQIASRVFALQRYSDPERNIPALQNAIKAHFEDKSLHYLLIDSLLEKGDLPAAKDKLLKARSAAPEDPTLWCLQARYQFAEKNVEAAKITLKEAQKRDPERKNTCIARETLRQFNDPVRALRYWKANPAMQTALAPALQHKDFKNLRKSLEAL